MCFNVAAVKRISAEFTNTPFHTVRPKYVALRLCVLCRVKSLCEREKAAYFREDLTVIGRAGTIRNINLAETEM